jgi:hypothetical protein
MSTVSAACAVEQECHRGSADAIDVSEEDERVHGTSLDFTRALETLGPSQPAATARANPRR